MNLPPLPLLSFGGINEKQQEQKKKKQLDAALISSHYEAAEGNGKFCLLAKYSENIIQLWKPNGGKYHILEL